MKGKVTFDRDRCKGCELCTSVCPKHIVVMDATVLNKKGYHPAECSDDAACVSCAACARMCPDCAITVEK